MQIFIGLLLLYPLIGLALYGIVMVGVDQEEHRRIWEEERRRLGEDSPDATVDALKTLLLAMTIWPIMLLRSTRRS